jgi:zinc/manganese transport system substrate-binding protein
MIKAIILSTALIVGGPAAASADGLKVVASFSILGDIAATIGGDKVDVITLVGPDSDAHTYEPRPSDVAVVSEANIVLINGLGFEGFIERLAKTSATTATVIAVFNGVEVLSIEEGHDHEEGKAAIEGGHGHGAKDPHAFQSVPNVRASVKTIAEAFCAADKAKCAEYLANAKIYDAQLAALDQEIRDSAAAIPEAKRTVITSHDAFGYLAHEYGLKFIAPEGISTDSEASAADIAKLIDQIRDNKAAALFVENISDPRLIDQIASETGIQIGGTLYSDALSGKNGPASTYIDMMRYNIGTIKGAITGY